MLVVRVGLILFGLLISEVANASDGVPESAGEAAPSKHTVAPSAQSESKATSRRTSWTGDRLALLAHLGIGAPGGALGLDLDVAPIPYLALNASIGRSPSGAQYAVMPRVRVPIGTFAAGQHTWLTFGAGPSAGRYINGNANAGLGCLFLCALEQNGEGKATQTFKRAIWLNLELGLDVYSAEGRGLLRTTLGYGSILNDKDYTCPAPVGSSSYPPDGGCDRDSGHALAFFTFAYGLDI
jgi:hypothetical protein